MDLLAPHRQIGLYAGSFNPIHIGHLALANWLVEFTGLDELWFVVTPQNPWKVNADLMPDARRLEMVEAAIRPYPRFRSCDIEFRLPKPSYTIDTLRALSASYPGCRFHLIVGADNWLRFDHWKASEEILSQYSLLVYPRKGYPLDRIPPHPHVQIVDAPELEVSSTFIRESIASGRDVRFFLPEAVWPYFY